MYLDGRADFAKGVARSNLNISLFGLEYCLRIRWLSSQWLLCFSRDFIDMTCMETFSAGLLFQKFVGCVLLLLKVRRTLNTLDNIDEGVKVTLMYILHKNSLKRENGIQIASRSLQLWFNRQMLLLTHWSIMPWHLNNVGTICSGQYTVARIVQKKWS